MEYLCLTILAISFLATFLFLTPNYSRRRLNFPDGPKPWPIVGNLNLIGPLPHQSFHKLSQIYGPIMQLQFGSCPVIIVSSSEFAKLFLQTHDHVFATRPQTAAGKYTTYDYNNITWAPYGPYWRQGRKIYLSELFSSKRLDSYEYIRIEERNDFVSRLYGFLDRPVLLKEEISRITLGIISRIVLGKKYFNENGKGDSIVTFDEFQEMLDELFLLNGVLNIGDWIPWLGFLDLQGYVKRMKILKKKFDKFHDHVFDEHKKKRNGSNEFEGMDMVDLLLKLADDPNLDVKLSYDSVKGFTQDLIAGGTDTSATTIEWAMSELIKNPETIKKATQELDKVIGKNRWVEEKDIQNLPYIDAIIKETMRLHPVAVLLAPHQARSDCQINGGYDILKGTTIFINTWSIGRDPKIWTDPEKFSPERFLGKVIDVKGQHFELLPFGSGRRMCPGFSLGLKMIRSILGNLLHGFDWKLANGMGIDDLSMDEVYGLATPRKYPLNVVMEPRLPPHLYEINSTNNILK